MNGTPLPPKKEVALALLERGSVHVHLDPRAAGVVVPAWFKRQPQLVLQVGLNMPVPIPDLRVDDDGMSCTLSFNRAPFFCVVPWSSVYAMVGDDGRGMVWPEDVPPEVALQARAREAGPPAKQPPAARALTAVKPAVERPRASSSSKNPAKPRAIRGTADAAAKTKKPRAKKARPDASPTAIGVAGREVRNGPKPEKGRGVLIAIPSAATKPASSPAEHASRRPASSSARDERPAANPAASSKPVHPMTGQPKTESPTADPPTPQPSGRKPGAGRTKREIPPYLRVVK